MIFCGAAAAEEAHSKPAAKEMREANINRAREEQLSRHEKEQWYEIAIIVIAKRQVLLPLERKKERKMVTTSVTIAQRVSCTRGCADGPAMWGDSAP